jgi:quercetin dioxygenase-like cupin family protein
MGSQIATHRAGALRPKALSSQQRASYSSRERSNCRVGFLASLGYNFEEALGGDGARPGDLLRASERTMTDKADAAVQKAVAIPPDDPLRQLATVQPEIDQKIRHVGVVGDTYTILLTGKETAGRFCLIDMYVPPGGGPPPHRHDFEETFTLLEGELDVVFRGAKQVVRAGETIHIPANAPHQFHNSSTRPVRMLCVCSPAGQEQFFLEVGIPVAARTTPPPKLDETAQAELKAKAAALAPKYRTEFLQHA